MKKITFLVAALCATTLAFATATGVKVTSPATLKAGDKIAITNFDGSKAMNKEQTASEGKNYYRGSAAFDATNVSTDVELIELVASGENFKLKVTGGYLYFDATWTKNWLGTNKTGTDFKFEAAGDTVRAVEVASGRYIMFNSGTTPARFSAYTTTSGMRSDGGTAIYVVTGEQEEPVIESKTIAEFIAAKGVKCYLTGVVGKIDNDTYGNFNLTDKSGTIYVYGCLTAAKESSKFSTLGVKQGDTLTVLAETYKLYEGTSEVVNAIYVSHIEGEGSGETATLDVTCTTIEAYNYEDYYGVGGDDIQFYISTEDTHNAIQFEIILAQGTGIGGSVLPEGTYEIVDYTEAAVGKAVAGDYYEEYDQYDGSWWFDYANSYAYSLVSGSIAITKTDDAYTIVVDALTGDGGSVKAKYTGTIEVEEGQYTAIRNIEVLNDVYAREGRIYAEEGAQIYTIMGLNVTEQNKKSTLGEGIYIVKAGNKLAKIVVK